jgi:hypothetical protein
MDEKEGWWMGYRKETKEFITFWLEGYRRLPPLEQEAKTFLQQPALCYLFGFPGCSLY